MVRTAFILFFLGAVIGTLGDLCHVLSFTDGYANAFLPLPTGQPLWVPFLFGGATMAIGLGHPWADRVLFSKWKRIKLHKKQIILGGISFHILYSISGFLPLEPTLFRDISMMLGAIATWLAFDRSTPGILLAIVTAGAGTAFEINLVRQGGFYYYPHSSQLMGVPTWLPWLYVTASITVGNIGRYLQPSKPRRT